MAGATDVDTIALSMANRATTTSESIKIAAYTIVIAVISNTLVKAGMAAFMGAPAMRRTIVLVTLILFIAAAAGSLMAWSICWFTNLATNLISDRVMAAYAIPVSLAYAGPAGLPPQVGIYGYLLGNLGYALWCWQANDSKLWKVVTMDAAYVSAFAALGGALIGGLTSFATSWITQQTQARAQQLEHKLTKREELYKDFIEEASRLYADSLVHDTPDVSQLIKLYVMISGMRILASTRIVENADKVARMIVNNYLMPNKTFPELRDMVNRGAMDPLRDFSEACREEIQRLQ